MKVIVPQSPKHFLQLSHILLQGLTVDDNAIKGNNNKTIKERSQQLFMRMQNVASALVAKGHGKELI